MGPMKLVISGPVGAGKTTFVQTLSETEVVATEAEASE
ncbi:MAG: deoxynucleoside kinase, partial [Deinococcus sp.]|nr:deoxynucleoside kinase [Deinococcus sp.]